MQLVLSSHAMPVLSDARLSFSEGMMKHGVNPCLLVSPNQPRVLPVPVLMHDDCSCCAWLSQAGLRGVGWGSAGVVFGELAYEQPTIDAASVLSTRPFFAPLLLRGVIRGRARSAPLLR